MHVNIQQVSSILLNYLCSRSIAFHNSDNSGTVRIVTELLRVLRANVHVRVCVFFFCVCAVANPVVCACLKKKKKKKLCAVFVCKQRSLLQEKNLEKDQHI